MKHIVKAIANMHSEERLPELDHGDDYVVIEMGGTHEIEVAVDPECIRLYSRTLGEFRLPLSVSGEDAADVVRKIFVGDGAASHAAARLWEHRA